MYQNASSSYAEKIWQDSRKFRAVIYDQSGAEAGIIKRYSIQKHSSSGQDMTIGAAFSASCSITLQTEESFKRQEVILMTGMDEELIPDGVFTIVSSTPLNGSDNIRTLSGYDRMYIKGSDVINIPTGDQYYKTRVEAVCEMLGVDLDEECLTDIDDFIVSMPEDQETTVSEYTGWLAGLIGRNAYIDRLGRLTIKASTDFGYEVTDDRSKTSGIEDEPRTITAITCNDTFTDLWAGDPNCLIPLVTERNPMMIQEYLETVMTGLESFTYYGGGLALVLGDNRIDPWDILSYKGKKILCGDITYDYDGGFQQNIESYALANAADAGTDIYADISAAKQMLKSTITGISYLYAVSDSDQTAPTDGWSESRPVRQDGQYIWSKQVIQYADGHTEVSPPSCESGRDGKDGEDAALLKISSSKGILFKSTSFQTELTVTVFVGSKEITTITALRAQFGPGAMLAWKWRKFDDEAFHTIAASDPRLSDDGFTLAITPDDVDEKIVFQCDLIS